MVNLSNDDYLMTVRLLKAFASSKGSTRKENEERRQAYLLLRKWEKRQRKPK